MPLGRFKKLRISYLFACIIALPLLFFFNNCTGSFEAAGPLTAKDLSSELADDPQALTRFAKAQNVMQKSCNQCHQAGGSAGHKSFTLTSQSDFVTAGLVAPGNIDASPLITRSIHYTGSATLLRNMPQGGYEVGYTQADHDTLVDWVLNMVKPPANTVVDQFICTDDTQSSVTKSLVLSKLQYMNAMEDLFGNTVLQGAMAELSTIPSEVNDPFTNERLSLPQDSDMETYANIGYTIAGLVVNNKTRRESIFGTCSTLNSPATSCIDNYLNNFATKIFRRPLTSAEKTFAKNLANSGGIYLTNLEAILAYHLMSPYFLARVEIGTTSQSSATRLKLTPHEVATRIAFEVTDSIPDAQLLSAANAGQLNTVSGIKTQELRLLNTTRGKKKVVDSLTWWAQSDKTAGVQSLPSTFLNGISITNLDQAMTDEARLFVEEVIYKDNGSFKDLLTSKKSMAKDPQVASIYGHAPVTTTPAQMSGRRQGLLMRAPFMTWSNTRSSIIHRGVDFQKRILCNDIPTPTVDVVDDRDLNVLPHNVFLNTSNRDAITYQTAAPVCMSCHSMINPVGFAFENFDSIGRMRTTEKIFDTDGSYVRDISIDTNTSIPISQDNTLNVSDAVDLVNFVITSQEGTACLARNMYRYYNEKKEAVEDSCELKRAQSLILDSSKPLIEAIAETVANEHIFEKVK
ncbi:MAG: DUF1588 domain-containing protein [Bdellovibrionales bacterium]|nr:DUF1588 domain-containing protein [Bdellovibrionales bacterium]